MSEVLVAAEGLARHYRLRGGRTLRALDGIDLGIGPRATLGLVGESGSGKSTLGRTLVGLQPPTLGRVRFEGRDAGATDPATLRRLRQQRQIIFQDPSGALNPRMTVGDTIVEHLRVQGWSRPEARARAAAVIERAGLQADFLPRYPHEISGGQRQRVVIARAISTDPAFIVADEPVSALDVSTRAQIMNLLRDLQAERGLTMLFISHDLSVVAHMCRDVAVMYLGRIVELAPRAALFRAPRHPYTAALLAAIPLLDPVRERARARTRLKGEPPDPSAVPRGCRFHPRCPRATDICLAVDPPTRALDPGHRFACHHPLDPA
ncbi:MAG: ABC transporter ATP-binding protein [Rhodobacteraceae bacterium]|nr:ABC transporter ATP-binding protein [Paracoccaceae bacterium]